MNISYVKVMLRAKSDNRRNMYLHIGQNHYLHRVVAQTVYNELNKSFDGFYNDFDMEIHHRLIGETGTIQGNQLQNLTVLTDKDHKRLHKLLHDIKVFEFDSGKR